MPRRTNIAWQAGHRRRRTAGARAEGAPRAIRARTVHPPRPHAEARTRLHTEQARDKDARYASSAAGRRTSTWDGAPLPSWATAGKAPPAAAAALPTWNACPLGRNRMAWPIGCAPPNARRPPRRNGHRSSPKKARHRPATAPTRARGSAPPHDANCAQRPPPLHPEGERAGPCAGTAAVAPQQRRCHARLRAPRQPQPQRRLSGRKPWPASPSRAARATVAPQQRPHAQRYSSRVGSLVKAAARGVPVGNYPADMWGANCRARRSALGSSSRAPATRGTPPTPEQTCSDSVTMGTRPADPSASHKAAESSRAAPSGHPQRHR